MNRNWKTFFTATTMIVEENDSVDYVDEFSKKTERIKEHIGLVDINHVQHE